MGTGTSLGDTVAVEAPKKAEASGWNAGARPVWSRGCMSNTSMFFLQLDMVNQMGQATSFQQLFFKILALAIPC